MTGKFLAVGECMMELTPSSKDMFAKGFAGDTYNALVYAKRLNQTLTTSMLTAVGDDIPSQEMLTRWAQEGIDNSSTLITNQATIGLYAISTDSLGERSFSYWRAGSAASQMMTYKSVDELAQLNADADLVFFSGISLSILTDQDKSKLIELMAKLKQNGCKIAFDPNYRPKMWNNSAHAIQWLAAAYQVSDIIMPGIEEHEQLLGHKTQQDILDYCCSFGDCEVVIKCGENGVYGYKNGQLQHHQPFEPAPVQVDSTAAGDSFAGTYLAARLSGDSIELSIKKACFIAGKVVQHKGAILAKPIYQQAAVEFSAVE
ncbi:sugar kinase [Thalassotalea sp. PLHSN55]|uniref:sugar kinase n=1 Tax=Thalassotalea sp. PLHSN55 TaxID=3435888 RepID=UPI003F87F7CD